MKQRDNPDSTYKEQVYEWLGLAYQEENVEVVPAETLEKKKSQCECQIIPILEKYLKDDDGESRDFVKLSTTVLKKIVDEILDITHDAGILNSEFSLYPRENPSNARNNLQKILDWFGSSYHTERSENKTGILARGKQEKKDKQSSTSSLKPATSGKE